MRPGPLQTRLHPLSDASTLELGQRREDMQLQPPSWRRAVDPLAERDERHAERVEVIEQGDQVPEVPAEPIQAPTHQDVEPSARGVSEEAVERWPPILGA